jgi:predicted lipoprotein with Yx(FWY)xxD motif
MKRILSHRSAYLIGILAIVMLMATACTYTSSSTPSPGSTASSMDSYTISTMSKTDLGEYLVDGKGMTLYYFTKDSVGKSNASDAIIAIWPIFYAANVVVPSNLNAPDFGTITRSDGKMQTTYKGWPLYYYIKDQAPGDTIGQGVNNVWFVVNPDSFSPGGGSY